MKVTWNNKSPRIMKFQSPALNDESFYNHRVPFPFLLRGCTKVCRALRNLPIKNLHSSYNTTHATWQTYFYFTKAFSIMSNVGRTETAVVTSFLLLVHVQYKYKYQHYWTNYPSQMQSRSQLKENIWHQYLLHQCSFLKKFCSK